MLNQDVNQTIHYQKDLKSQKIKILNVLWYLNVQRVFPYDVLIFLLHSFKANEHLESRTQMTHGKENLTHQMERRQQPKKRGQLGSRQALIHASQVWCMETGNNDLVINDHAGSIHCMQQPGFSHG